MTANSPDTLPLREHREDSGFVSGIEAGGLERAPFIGQTELFHDFALGLKPIAQGSVGARASCTPKLLRALFDLLLDQQVFRRRKIGPGVTRSDIHRVCLCPRQIQGALGW